MSTTLPSSSADLWESGRLATASRARPVGDGILRRRWIAAALLASCAGVMAAYVGVLERAVSRSEAMHDETHARAVAEARCESSQPAGARATCLAIFDGGQAVAGAADADVTPPNDVAAPAGRLATASLGAPAGLADVQQ